MEGAMIGVALAWLLFFAVLLELVIGGVALGIRALFPVWHE
jgi:hypothetical protein